MAASPDNGGLPAGGHRRWRSSASARSATTGPWAAATAAIRPDVPPVAGMALTPDAPGYWLLEPDGWSYSFSNPPDPPPSPTGGGHRVHGQQPGGHRPRPGLLLQSLRAVRGVVRPVRHLGVERAGVPIPSYPFTGGIYNWAAAHTGGAPADGRAAARGRRALRHRSLVDGDLAPRGPGHAGVAGRGHRHHRGRCRPGADRSLAVVINGPYLPSRSARYNGMPIYAFARP